MDFAPYQSSPPEHGRVASPDYNHNTSPRASQDIRQPFPPQQQTRSPPPLQHPQPQREWSGFQGQTSGWANGNNLGGGQPTSADGAYNYRSAEFSEFDTGLGLRLDVEACLAYMACPPLGAIFLLILERNSDYVRFHAWQSSLMFTVMMIAHLILAWSRFLSWILLLFDIGLIAFMTMRAYKDAAILDRFELPLFGRIASRFVDDE